MICSVILSEIEIQEPWPVIFGWAREHCDSFTGMTDISNMAWVTYAFNFDNEMDKLAFLLKWKNVG